MINQTKGKNCIDTISFIVLTDSNNTVHFEWTILKPNRKESCIKTYTLK